MIQYDKVMKKVALFFTFLLLGTSGVFAQSSKYDVNDDGDVNITDVIELVNFILGKQHEAVDLGLPSGTKWSSCNVGATKPEEHGGYYAWGETEEKDVYDWSTYIHCGGSEWSCHNIGSNISGTEYDVAHVKWGGKWCMPTAYDIHELLDNCTYEWTTLNGVKGMKFTSKINRNSIFLPAAGVRLGGELYDVGKLGCYWSSILQFPEDDSRITDHLYFISGNAYLDDCTREHGQSVRPVVRN